MTEKQKEAVKTLNNLRKRMTEDEYFNILECITESAWYYTSPTPYPTFQDLERMADRTAISYECNTEDDGN